MFISAQFIDTPLFFSDTQETKSDYLSLALDSTTGDSSSIYSVQSYSWNSLYFEKVSRQSFDIRCMGKKKDPVLQKESMVILLFYIL